MTEEVTLKRRGDNWQVYASQLIESRTFEQDVSRACSTFLI